MKLSKIYPFLLVFILFATSCQPTPLSQAVINKNDGNLEIIIAQEAIDVNQVNFPGQNRVTITPEKFQMLAFMK